MRTHRITLQVMLLIGATALLPAAALSAPPGPGGPAGGPAAHDTGSAGNGPSGGPAADQGHGPSEDKGHGPPADSGSGPGAAKPGGGPGKPDGGPAAGGPAGKTPGGPKGKGPAAPDQLPAGGEITVPDQDEAIAAVRSGAAMPLADLLSQANLQGSVVDARLISVKGFLIYQIKVLSPDKSTLETYYYYARSGIRIGGN